MDMRTFFDAQAGNKVWDILRGWGKIVSIERLDQYPIKVTFYSNIDAIEYTFDGKYSIHHINPSLYYSEVKIVPSLKAKSEPKCIGKGMEIIDALNKSRKVSKFGDPTVYASLVNGVLIWNDSCAPVGLVHIAEGYWEVYKEECEACELKDEFIENNVIDVAMTYLLNQHHTCEKERKEK